MAVGKVGKVRVVRAGVSAGTGTRTAWIASADAAATAPAVRAGIWRSGRAGTPGVSASAPDPRTLDDTADLPFRGAEVLEPDTDTLDTVDLPIQPYDEPVLEEGLDTEARRGVLSEMTGGPEEIEPVEERTFVVSSGDDDTGEHALVMDEPVELPELPEFAAPAGESGESGEPPRATFERTEIPGAGFTRDEFPVAAGADARRRRRAAGVAAAVAGGVRTGGPNAASQPGGGPSSDAGGEPDDTPNRGRKTTTTIPTSKSSRRLRKHPDLRNYNEDYGS